MIRTREGSPHARQRTLSRKFIKIRMVAGDSAEAARVAHNALVELPPSQIEKRWNGKGWNGLSGAPKVTPRGVRRIQSALSRRQRQDRKESRAFFRARSEAERREARELGLEEPVTDHQKAHDAGVKFKATHDERYREGFEEGSP